jgi:AmmeMemoRadiSam system protein B
MTETITVRPSPIAGTWYSADPDQLRQTVDEYIGNAEIPELSGEVLGLVSPHAGYRYSGSVAGHAYKCVKGKSFDIVVVISPMHQYYPKPVLTSAHSAYSTPLGEIPLALQKLNEINTALRNKTGVEMSRISHDQEHSLEIELPFLQQSLDGDFALIPIMLRNQSRQFSKALGAVLAENLRNHSCLFVASSDLSHFYPAPEANQLDHIVLQQVTDFSPDGLFDLKDEGKGHACGLAAIASVLWATEALGATNVTLLKYDTSASATGDESSVVGYGAAAITRTD